MSFHSQFGEDRFIFENLPLPERGFFVEVGAYDGVASSNTLAFEQEGWRGVCMEPDPEIAAACTRNRNATVILAAAGLTRSRIPFYVNPKDRGTSSLIYSEGWIPLTVDVIPISDVFNSHQCPDLLSVDTEGTELDVIDGMDQYRPGIVIVEFWTQPNPPRDKQIVEHMEYLGYKEVHRTTANLIFTKA